MSKKAVIVTGGKQYLVTEGDEMFIERLNTTDKKVDFTPLLIIDGSKTTVGTPEVTGSKVTADVLEASVQAKKVQVLKFQSKKRVRSLRGHRQVRTQIKITSIK